MADRDERPEMLAALLRQEQEMQLHGMELWKRLWEDRGMASIQKLEERNARAVDAHERTAQRLAALKAKFDREEKVLQARRDKVNMLWVKKFAELAEKENIQVSKIDAEQLLALVKENKDVLIDDIVTSQSNSDEKDLAEAGVTAVQKMGGDSL